MELQDLLDRLDQEVGLASTLRLCLKFNLHSVITPLLKYVDRLTETLVPAIYGPSVTVGP